jgi:gliding motility-associated protein GldM
MNISKDVLDAFKTVNTGLEKTKSTLLGKSTTTMTDFEAKFTQNKDKVGPFITEARKVEDEAKQIIAHIEQMKARVMAASHRGNKDGTGWEEYFDKANGVAISMNDEKIKKPDENQNNTAMLIGGDPTKPRKDPWSASELRGKLEAYAAFLSSVTVKEVTGATWTPTQAFKDGISRTFSFPDEKEDDNTVQWETKNFFHVPMAAVITNLTKLQVDVENAKADMLTELTSGIEGKSYKFTSLVPLVVPESNYVLRGDSFRANILLAAYDATNAPAIYVSNSLRAEGDSTPYVPDGGASPIRVGSDGLGKLRLASSSLGLGEKSFKGVIKYKGPSGEIEDHPFIVPAFTVAEPALVVSPTKMNVFYRGLPNPVEISVPGIPQEKLQVSISGNHQITKDGGIWMVKPGGDKEATISVTATMPDGSKQKMGDKMFRVKPIPDPVPIFAGKKPTDTTVPKADAVVASGIIAKMENFDFEVSVKVKSFSMVFIRDGQVIEKNSPSNALTDEMLANLKKVGQGQKIYIEKINVSMPDGSVRPVSNISLRVT